MSNKPIYHYVYRITNILENKHYYGKRKSTIEPKLDLGRKYFSSSTNKEFRKDQKENPQNYKYKIIWVTDNSYNATQLEIKLHDRFDVAVNVNFYNKAKQTSTKFDTTGISPNITKEGVERRSGFNHHEAIPIDIYNYFTREKIATNVIATRWCKEVLNVQSGGLTKTLKCDPSKPHGKKNVCVSYGIFAEYHGVDATYKFSDEHIQQTLDNYTPKTLVDVYNYFTGELVEEKTFSSTFVGSNGKVFNTLLNTLSADPSKPHNTSKTENRNVCHVGGYYVVAYEDIPTMEKKNKPRKFSIEHVKETEKGLKISHLIDIRNYYTGELIAEKVYVSEWCRENGYSRSELGKTLQADPKKPHLSERTNKNYNPCHTKGIYAVLYENIPLEEKLKMPNKYSKEHIEASKNNKKAKNAILIDIFDHYTDNLIVAKVVASVWCPENGYHIPSLLYTLKADRSKPHCSSVGYPNFNFTHHKGIYAKLHNPK
jgi:hypothetical protein